jgi:hypothetical protein
MYLDLKIWLQKNEEQPAGADPRIRPNALS